MTLYIPINANAYLSITLKTHNMLVEISCFIYACEDENLLQPHLTCQMDVSYI